MQISLDAELPGTNPEVGPLPSFRGSKDQCHLGVLVLSDTSGIVVSVDPTKAEEVVIRVSLGIF